VVVEKRHTKIPRRDKVSEQFYSYLVYQKRPRVRGRSYPYSGSSVSHFYSY
jgi:hypothetical protein